MLPLGNRSQAADVENFSFLTTNHYDMFLAPAGLDAVDFGSWSSLSSPTHVSEKVPRGLFLTHLSPLAWRPCIYFSKEYKVYPCLQAEASCEGLRSRLNQPLLEIDLSMTQAPCRFLSFKKPGAWGV